MFKATKLSLKFTNQSYKVGLQSFIAEYQRVAQLICTQLWSIKLIPTFIDPNELKIETWLGSGPMQACSKQVVALIKGTRESRFKLHSTETSCPDASQIEPCLDRRLFSLDLDPDNSFDYWIELKSLRKVEYKHSMGKLELRFPLKSTSHDNKLKAKGKLLNSIHISSKFVTLVYELPDPLIAQGSTIGIDIGIVAPTTCSNGKPNPIHPHGHTLSKIQSKLARKVKGSKNFHQAQDLRRNYINWWINQLDFTGVGAVKLENIFQMWKGKSIDRFRSHWSYPLIYQKLGSKCTEAGVRIQYINQAYTSQKCPVCGAVDKRNRNGTKFCCISCGYSGNADSVASTNICSSAPIGLKRGAYSLSCKDNRMVVIL